MNYKNNSRVIDNIILSVMDSHLYLGDYERFIAVQTLQYVVDKFDLNYFINNFDIEEDDYNIYFKEIVKIYDKPKHKEYKKIFRKEKNSLKENEFYIDREVVFESIYKNDYYDTDYKKMNVINTLQFFFDKFKLESFIQNNNVSMDDYIQYFQKNTQNFNKHLDTYILENYTNKGE